MRNLIDPSTTPKRMGISLSSLDGEWKLIVVSECCLSVLKWTNSGNRCSECNVSTSFRGYTDNSLKLDGMEDLVYWIQAWTGLENVKVSVQW